MLLAQFDYKQARNVSRSYNDVHAPMNWKAENSWISDLSELCGFICYRGAYSCCETFEKIKNGKKQINRNSRVTEKTVVVFNKSLSEALPKGFKEKPKI